MLMELLFWLRGGDWWVSNRESKPQTQPESTKNLLGQLKHIENVENTQNAWF